MDKNGRISIEDLRSVAAELGEQTTEQELQEMIARADLDHDGTVSVEEFVRLMKRGP